MSKERRVKVVIYNMPPSAEDFVVARLVNTELWYYGSYETQERAEVVAEQLGNGVVLDITED